MAPIARLTLGIIASLVCILALYGVQADICCVYDQFETNIYYDNGNVFIDHPGRLGTAYSYINASIRAAYDYTNKRTYMNVSTTQLSPLVPKPVIEQYAFINDYKSGVQYQFTDKACKQNPIGQSMTRQCIPDDALQMSSGFIGNNEAGVATYNFVRGSDPYRYIATVQPKTCIPVYLVYITSATVPDSGTLNFVQTGNVTKGIKDKSIFTPPKFCNKVSGKFFKTESSPVQRMMSRFSQRFPYSSD